MIENLELMALHYLRFERRCPVALFERSPRRNVGEPDVLGITQSRYMLEIEIKRSLSDFHANADKHHLRWRYSMERRDNDVMLAKAPKLFWFLVPASLVEKVLPHVPEWAGLLRGPIGSEVGWLYQVKAAPTNNLSMRLSAREMLLLGRCMANQILSNTRLLACSRCYYEPYPWHPDI